MWQVLTEKDVLICMGKFVLFLRKHVPKTKKLDFKMYSPDEKTDFLLSCDRDINSCFFTIRILKLGRFWNNGKNNTSN